MHNYLDLWLEVRRVDSPFAGFIGVFGLQYYDSWNGAMAVEVAREIFGKILIS